MRTMNALIVAGVAGTMLAAFLVGCTYRPRSAPSSARRVDEVARFQQDQCTGVGVTRDERVLVSFPLWHDGHRVHVAQVMSDGAYQPWPNDAWNRWREGQVASADVFVCVQSVVVDDMNRVWVLDPASPRMAGVTPPGAFPKLVMFDAASGAAQRTYDLSSVAPAGSYLNDVRVDTGAGFAFMTDSSLGGLVVLDLASGSARRVLGGDPRTMAEPDVVPIVEGRELRFAGGPMAGQVPQVHADGIALDAPRGWLYWQALTARTLYRVPTGLLMDAAADDALISGAVERVGTTVMTDGMEIDSSGNIYFAAFERDAVMVRTPDGAMHELTRSPLLAWPDSLALGPGGSLYFTVAQIHRTSWFSPDGSMPREPYRVFRTSALGR